MKWIEIDELEKTNNKLQQTNQKLDEINTKLDEINTKTNEINEKITLIHDYFNKALNLEILTALFDILQKNYIKLTVHNIQPNDLIASHLYDLSFNGVNQYLEIPTTVIIPGETRLSILTWSYFNTIPYEVQVIVKQGYGYVYGTYYIFTQYNNIYRCALRGTDGAWTAPSAGPIYTNTWYFLGLRYDGSEVSLWINAEKRTSESFSSPIGVNQPTRVGHPYDVSSVYLNGKIGNILIYNRALSSDEISQSYGQQIVNASGLKVFIDPTFFDELKYIDLSGNNNHAYPYNNPQRIDATNKWMYIIRNMYSDGYIRFLLPRDSLVIWSSGKITTVECLEPIFYDGTHYWCLYTTTQKGDSATIYIPQ